MNRARERRVAVTGLGIVCCLGNAYADVIRRLRNGESGVRAVPEWAKLGVRSLVAGTLDGVEAKRRAARIPKELLFGMSDGALYCALSALDAVQDAGLSETELQSIRVGCFIGNASFGMARTAYEQSKLAYSGQSRRIPPFTLLQCMSSSASASVANLLKILGPSYSIAAACASSAHNIGHAYSLIRSGAIDIAVAGGGEEVNELIAACFEPVRTALSTGYNETPQIASRPFDASRDGFVLSGGGGIVVLEALDHAQARGANVRAEIIGYGATSDGHSMVAARPDGAQAAACMQMAIDDAKVEREDIDYVNAHATSTVAGDDAEVRALRRVFGARVPSFSSTKSMTGHAMAAAGVHELIYCIGMLEQGFLAPSINIDRLDPAFEGLPLIQVTMDRTATTVLTNSFGFGGTNASIVLRRTTEA
ncbi:MAG: beta-ketoacyl synthase N-terminal-like domain-containing protein [Gemmatimonadaceae bacterium]